MAKLMWICGILLAAAGVAIGVIVLVSPAQPAFAGLDTAAILLVGGVLAGGLGSVIDGFRRLPVDEAMHFAAAEQAPAAPIPEFGPRAAKAAAAAAAASAPPPEVSEPTRDTIQALEQARQKIEQAFDTKKPSVEPPARQEPEAAAPAEEEEATAEEADAPEDAADEGQLYVVEERVIRRHPARVLSDGTVEAETGEGWMRFENLEHLDEYLDATEPAKG